MKKILILTMLVCMVACNSQNLSKNSNSHSSQQGSNSQGSNSFISSDTNDDIEDDYDDGTFNEFENAVYSRNAKEILRSQTQIREASDHLSVNQNIRSRRNVEYSSSKVSSTSSTLVSTGPTFEELSQELSGEFHISGYDAESTSKMMNEPCSIAFNVLQNLIFSGNGSYNFSGKTIKYGNFGGLIRINRFNESNNLTLIRYGDYNMFINCDGDNSYVFSISAEENGIYYLNFASKDGSLIYFNCSKTIDEEFNLMVEALDKFNEFKVDSLSFKLFRNILLEEGNDDNWKNTIDLDISDFSMKQLYFQNIKELYFSRHRRLTGSKDYLIINEGTLEGIDSLVTSFYLPIPDNVVKIGRLQDKTRYYNVSAVYIPSSVKELEKGSFEGLGVEMFFIDELKENLSEEYINELKTSCPTARIYYKDKWENYNDIIIPKEYYFTIYENNIEGISIKEKVDVLNKILSFSKIIPAEKYNELLDKFNELVYKLANEPEFINESDEHLYAFYDEVFLNTTSELKYWYTKIEDNKEVKVENVTGEMFVNNNINIIFDNNVIYEQITIDFNTSSWPTIQLNEIFGENIIPDFNNEDLVFSSEYSGRSVSIACYSISEEQVNEYKTILVNIGFQANGDIYWIRIGERIVNINLYFREDYLRIDIGTNQNKLPEPTTDVTLSYHKISMSNWPDIEEYKEMIPFYNEDLPKIIIENDSSFNVNFYEYSTSSTIVCVFKNNEAAVEQFVNRIKDLGYITDESEEEKEDYDNFYEKVYYIDENIAQISHVVVINIRVTGEYCHITYSIK